VYFWNSRGFANITNLLAKDRNYFFSHDIIGFCETFIEIKNCSRFDVFTSEFFVLDHPATRISRGGRASGGLLLLVKKANFDLCHVECFSDAIAATVIHKKTAEVCRRTLLHITGEERY